MKTISPLSPQKAKAVASSPEALQVEIARINAALRLGKRTFMLSNSDERLADMLKEAYKAAGWRFVSIAYRRQRLMLTLGA